MDIGEFRNQCYKYVIETIVPDIVLEDDAGTKYELPYSLENESTDQFGMNPSTGDKPWLKIQVSDIEQSLRFLGSNDVRVEALLVLTIFLPVDSAMCDQDSIVAGLQTFMQGRIPGTEIRFSDDKNYLKRIGTDAKWNITAVTRGLYYYSTQD